MDKIEVDKTNYINIARKWFRIGYIMKFPIRIGYIMVYK